MTEQAWLDDGETGPPTVEDDMWYLENVVAAGYPRVRRDAEPYPGQLSITEAIDDQGWWEAYDRDEPYPDVRE